MRSQLLVLGVALFVGHGGQPLQSPRVDRGAQAPRPAGTADANATEFLAAARGATPAICSLAALPLGDHWGGHGAPMDPAAAETALVEWALKPSMDERDLTVLEAGLNDNDACVRSMAARLLAAGGPEGVRILLGGLSAERAESRRVAAEGLGHAEDATTATALLRRLRDDDAIVRATVVWALGRMEATDAVDDIGALLSDPVPTVRLAAVEALGELEVDSSIDLLLPMLADDDARVRAATARSIGELH